MEPGIILVVLIILGIPVALAIWLIVRAISAKNRIEELSDRLIALESEIIRLKREKEPPKPVEPAPAPAPQPQIIATPPPPCQSQPSHRNPSFLRNFRPSSRRRQFRRRLRRRNGRAFSRRRRLPAPKINWEQFMGVKGSRGSADLRCSSASRSSSNTRSTTTSSRRNCAWPSVFSPASACSSAAW